MNTIINSTYENFIQFEVMFFSIDLIKNHSVNVKLIFSAKRKPLSCSIKLLQVLLVLKFPWMKGHENLISSLIDWKKIYRRLLLHKKFKKIQ